MGITVICALPLFVKNCKVTLFIRANYHSCSNRTLSALLIIQKNQGEGQIIRILHLSLPRVNAKNIRTI